MKWTPKKLYLTGFLAAVFCTLGLWFYRESTFKKKPTPILSNLELWQTVQSMRLRHPPAQTTKRDDKLIALGRSVFFDKDFSQNKQIACSSCHRPEKSFTDGLPQSVGLAPTTMNAPTLINSYSSSWFFWDGRADSLAAQALGPIENPKEHGFTRAEIVKLILSKYKKPYEELFGHLDESTLSAALEKKYQPPSLVSKEVAAYALATMGSSVLQKRILKEADQLHIQPIEVLRKISASLPLATPPQNVLFTSKAIDQAVANVTQAVAAFERTIRSTDSPFDRFVDRFQKDHPPENFLNQEFTATELKGLRLFTGPGQCTLCHRGSYFKDDQFHNIGLMPLSDQTISLGRAQGLLLARQDPFNCKGAFHQKEEPSESCLELEFLETESAESVGAFKTPTLRNLKDTAPYGHDGRFQEVKEILFHYNHLKAPPTVGHTEESLVPLGLSEQDILALEGFLISLSGSVTYQGEN